MILRKWVLLPSVPIVIAGVVAVTRVGPTESDAAAKADPALASKPAGKVIAIVNGEPILEQELLSALPEDAFQDQLKGLKQGKLQRLVDETVQGQFLAKVGVVVSEEQINAEIESFKKMITTPGCPCCGGGFKNLPQFMSVNHFSDAEFRLMIINRIGLRRFAEQGVRGVGCYHWLIGFHRHRAAAKALEKVFLYGMKSAFFRNLNSLARLMDEWREQIKHDFVKGSVILFDDSRDAQDTGDPASLKARKLKLADEAWQRLKNNEPFEKVAREVSQHRASAVKGGDLGCVSADMFGPEVRAVWRKLPPGSFSDPIKTPWGCCIVRRAALTEADWRPLLSDWMGSIVLQQVVLPECASAKANSEIRYVGNVVPPEPRKVTSR